MNGLIGKKIGMTSIFSEEGKNIACTVIETGPCVVTQIKTDESDGYKSVQLAFDDAKEKNTSNQMMGHFKKAGVKPKRKLIEFRNFSVDDLLVDEGVDVFDLKIGSTISVDDVFLVGDKVNVVANSKGKGFQGVVKRHRFKGVNDATHGQHNRARAPGSIGAASYPAKVIKGMRMAGQMGGNRIKIQNLEVIGMFPEKNLLVIKGAVPGARGGYVIIEK